MAKIYIDIGHGGTDSTGSDTGTSGKYNGKSYQENEINLNIGLVVKKVLEGYGHTVVTQRTQNVNFGPIVGSYSRADSNLINSASNCNGTDCDCMISIHNNAYSSSSARGYVLIYKAGSEATDDVKAKSKTLCDDIEEFIKTSLPKNDVRKSLMSNGQDYYGILRLHNKIGVLIEAGFMTNSADMKVLVENYEKIGKNIADGINKFVGGAVIKEDTSKKDDSEKIKELEKKATDLTKKIIKLENKVQTLETKNLSLTNENKSLNDRLNKALAFDINKDGSTNEQDAIYLIKHILEPENYPL